MKLAPTTAAPIQVRCIPCNQSGLGVAHCQHPDECGGPWTRPYVVPMPYELHTLIEHLKDEARKDRDCGWPKKAAMKEQAAELLRRTAGVGTPLVPCPVCGGEAIHAQDMLSRVIIQGEDDV